MIRFLPSIRLLGIACLLLPRGGSAFVPRGGQSHHAASFSLSLSSSSSHHRRPSSYRVLPRSHHRRALTVMASDDDDDAFSCRKRGVASSASSSAAAIILSIGLLVLSPTMVRAIDDGASIAANSKITTGGASTLQSGRTIAITRGVNLDNSDFRNKNLRGVAFQQSIVRDSDFRNSNLVGASFFDATMDGSNFEGADMSLCNVEMAQFNRAILKNAVLREMYVSGSTLFEGVKDIEGSDWSETQLRKDQQKYLCGHPTAKGVNPTTGVDTRESLMCLD